MRYDSVTLMRWGFALLIVGLTLVAGPDKAEATIAVGGPDGSSFESLVREGVLCGLPEHEDADILIADDQTSSPTSLLCHKNAGLKSSDHCCCITVDTELGSASSSFAKIDQQPGWRSLLVPVSSSWLSIETPINSYQGSPDTPPPTLL